MKTLSHLTFERLMNNLNHLLMGDCTDPRSDRSKAVQDVIDCIVSGGDGGQIHKAMNSLAQRITELNAKLKTPTVY